MRSYELVFIVDPRLSDEEVVGLSQEYQEMIRSSGGTVTKEESWGKRKLAYQINKLREGRYVLLRLEAEGGSAFAEVEQRMRQNEQVLRFLRVRTDGGRLRERGAPEETGEPEAAAAAEDN